MMSGGIIEVIIMYMLQ